ncbi:MAG TPA: LysE family transporter [Candidatus Saccharimonadales bacterium]|nr:LysE family transporter [Candidatus Saccharimonadales bacterium]
MVPGQGILIRMNLIDFVGTVVVVTASGALAPGPLTFGIIVHGSEGGARSGIACALGHMIVEFPLVLALTFGLTAAIAQPVIKTTVGLVGGVGLICFGGMQIYETLTKKMPSKTKASNVPGSSILLGLVLTGLNPYFILWWFTIGSVLILQALTYAALLGVLIMYISHVWMDYAFLATLAHFGKRGKAFLGSQYYRFVLLAFGLILVYYGLTCLVAI